MNSIIIDKAELEKIVRAEIEKILKELNTPKNFITAKCVMSMLPISESTARRRIRKAREVLGKRPHEYLTREEFCQYYGL